MVQITRAGTVVRASGSDLEGLRLEFQTQHCLRLPQILDSGLLRLIQYHTHPSEFQEFVHEGVGAELCLVHNNTVGLLHFLANSPELFRVVEQITGCGRIGCFAGRVYRMLPSSHHHDSWHSDTIEDRLIAMSINLSAKIYAGGVLQIRDRKSKRILCEMPNRNSGDGILFRIAAGLQHRLTPMQGTTPKTAFAGWFKSQPDYPYLPRGDYT